MKMCPIKSVNLRGAAGWGDRDEARLRFLALKALEIQVELSSRQFEIIVLNSRKLSVRGE